MAELPLDAIHFVDSAQGLSHALHLEAVGGFVCHMLHCAQSSFRVYWAGGMICNVALVCFRGSDLPAAGSRPVSNLSLADRSHGLLNRHPRRLLASIWSGLIRSRGPVYSGCQEFPDAMELEREYV